MRGPGEMSGGVSHLDGGEGCKTEGGMKEQPLTILAQTIAFCFHPSHKGDIDSVSSS